MFSIKGHPGKDMCDSHLGMTRQDLLHVVVQVLGVSLIHAAW
ncbi:MAG: hypothetical protein R3C11_05740 [Planctomycetaceae bacterium]